MNGDKNYSSDSHACFFTNLTAYKKSNTNTADCIIRVRTNVMNNNRII